MAKIRRYTQIEEKLKLNRETGTSNVPANHNTSTMETKVCGRCKRELPTSKFQYNPFSKDRLTPWCKDCYREYLKEGLEKAVKGKTQSPKTKVCPVCKRELPASEFDRDQANKDGLSFRCKSCQLEYDKERLEELNKNLAKEQEQSPKTKVCSKCKRELPASEFNRDQANKDGLLSWCKSCQAEYDKGRYEKNKEAFDKGEKQIPKTKVCSKCKRELPASEFDINRTSQDGLRSWCKSCQVEYDKGRYEKNKEAFDKGEKQIPKTKVCSKCKRELPASEFHRDRTRKDGLSSKCKSCQVEYDKGRYEKNKENLAKEQEGKQSRVSTEASWETLFGEVIKHAILNPIEEMLKAKLKEIPNNPPPVPTPTILKVCDCCGREKPESLFVKGNDKIGLHNLCKDCSLILARNARGEWGEGKAKCPSCGEIKPKEEFCSDEDKFFLCKDCHDAANANPYHYYSTEKLIQEIKTLKANKQ